MLSTLRLAILLLVILVLHSPAAPVPPPPDKKQIAEWIKDLAARQFNKRDKAQKNLFDAGALAEEALREAAKDGDAEVKRRSQEILNKFKWGIYPSTPKPVVELIEQYQSADQNNKLAVVQKLFDQGSAGCAALIKVVAAEETEEVRREVYRIIAREAGRAIPLMAAERNHAMLETLLELTLNSDRDAILPNYVAFHLLQNSLDAKIAQFKKQAEGKDAEKAFEVLFFLHRAKGDVAGARDAAEKARRPELIVALLEERGLWKELAVKEHPMEERQPVERLGYRAAYQRLAGNSRGFDEAAAAIRKFAGEQEGESPDLWNAAKTLLLNARTEEGLALLGKGFTAQAKAEILAARMKFTEALDVAEKAAVAVQNGQGNVLPKETYEVIRARTLYFLGKKDEGRKLFAALGEKLKPGNEFTWHDTLIDAEVRVGLKEEAFEHCARALLATQNTFSQTRLLKKLFNGREDTAQVWWTVLRAKQASEQAGVSMKSLRQLLDGGIKGKELAGLLGELEQRLKTQPHEARADGQPRWLQAGGEVALKAGDTALAKAYFEKAATAAEAQTPLVKWGDYLAGKKSWAEAAEAYGSAWEKKRGEPLALYLRGWALAQAGQKKDGERLMDQAHWLPLGDPTVRLEFARELSIRGQPEAAKRERELIVKTSPPDSFQLGEAIRLNGVEAYRERKYLDAAFWHEVAMLRCHRTFISFIDTSAYVMVPHFIHSLRARGLIEAGKYDEAKAEIAFCEAAMPGNVELAIRLVPILEKQGRKKDADEMYQRTRAFKTGLIKEYPESAGLLNSIAWLSACCRRDLEDAQKHAEKSVTLEPNLPGHRDTLAEVLFQRGKKDDAIGHIKKCIEQDPKRNYYRKQLERMETGDPKADVPPETE